MFIGYSHTHKGYKCYILEARRVVVSRDVKFLESKGYYDEKSWDNLKDLSHEPSDRENNLRIIMESLGISQPQTSEAPSASPTPPVAEGAAHMIKMELPSLINLMKIKISLVENKNMKMQW